MQTHIEPGQMTGDGSRAVHALVSQKELNALQNKDAALGDSTAFTKRTSDGIPGAFFGIGETAAILLQTAQMVINWKNQYDAAKAREEDAAENITRATEDLNLSRRELAEKYNLGNAEAARYKEMLVASEGITGAKGAEAGAIVSAMAGEGALAGREADYESYLNEGISNALGGVLTADAGGGDQFADAISEAMGVERAAAGEETAAMADLLAAGGEDVRLMDEMARAEAVAAEGDTLKGGVDATREVDKLAMRDRRAKAEKARGLEKSRIEGRYKTLAPRVIGVDMPDVPDWLSKRGDPPTKFEATRPGGAPTSMPGRHPGT